MTHTSISDLVLDPKYYPTINGLENPKESSSVLEGAKEISGRSNPTLDENVSSSRSHPKTSMTDLVMDNITYDKILASSTKDLKLDMSNATGPSLSPVSLQPPVDVRTPPNTPSMLQETRYTSLMGLSSSITKPEKDENENSTV